MHPTATKMKLNQSPVGAPGNMAQKAVPAFGAVTVLMIWVTMLGRGLDAMPRPQRGAY